MNAKVDFGNDGVVVDVVITKDGNKWCCLAGENLQVGIAGFGNTAQNAVQEFKANFRNER